MRVSGAPHNSVAQGTSAPICAPENRKYILFVAILASALGFIDGAIVAIALPAMRVSLGADLVQAQWIHNAYMLTLSSLILVGGAFGDRFGLARVFGLGIALFVCSSLFCAMAPTPNFLIVARGFQGVGAAIMVPSSLAIIARAYPATERGRAIGIWAASSAFVTALGPIIGGLALTFAGPEMWRWVFAVNLPLGAIALWYLFRKVNIDRGKVGAPVDVFGATTATLALLLIAWGLTQSKDSESAMLWIVAGSIMVVVFLALQARSAHPMVPLKLFANPTFSAANLFSFTFYAALSMMFFFMPMTFIAGWNESEINTSAAFAPMSVFIAGFSARAGQLADRIGPRPLLVAGGLIVATGYASMGYFAPDQDLWLRVLPSMCLVGFGMALVVAPLSAAVMGAVQDRQSGVASGVNNAVSRMASLISVAAVGGLISHWYIAAGGVGSFGVASDAGNQALAMSFAFQRLAYLAAGLAVTSAVIATQIRRPAPQG